MINKLRKNLILLYMVSTSIIVTIVIVVLFIYSINQAKDFEKNNFKNFINTFTYYTQSNQVLSDDNLLKAELYNKMVIESRETNPNFKGKWEPKTNRDILLKRLENQSSKIIIGSPIFGDSIVQNIILLIKGDNKDYYYGTRIKFPDNSKVIYALYYLDPEKIIPMKKIVTYLLIEIIGVGLLFLLSRFLVKKSIKPVEINMQKQKEFVAAASHELKSPLAVIYANASAIKHEPSRTPYYLNGIINECQRMSKLIGDMLFLTSNDSHNWTIKKQVIDTEVFMIEIYESYYSFCSENNQALKLHLPETQLPSIYADKERLIQVFSILIDNAVTYSPENSTITIRTYIEEKNICFEFEDNGNGIPNEYKEYVFNRFYQVDSSRKDKKHFGLGLSIASEIVKLHNGKIELKDSLKGGCRFIVRLPLYIN